MRAERQFVVVEVALRGGDMAQEIAHRGLFHLFMRTLDRVCVFVLVNVDRREGAKIHRIGTRHERAVIVVWIKHLHRQRFPASGRTAVYEPCPSLADAAELFLDRRNQFVFYSVAVGSEIRRVHRVGIVVIRVGVLDLNHQKPGKARSGPLPIKLVGLFLLNSVVSGYVEPFAVFRFQIGVGWFRPKVRDIGGKVPMEQRQRVACFDVLVESLRHQDIGAQVHGPSPELGQQRGLNPQVTDVLGIGRRGDRRDFFRQ